MPTPNPMWREIATDLRRRVEGGEWLPGETLPSMRELAGDYKAQSHATVNRAIMSLITEGILITDLDAPRRGVRVRARPNIVRDLLIGTPLSKSSGPGQTFEHQTGARGVAVHVDYETITAPAEIAESLQIEIETPVLKRTFTYTIQGTPHQILASYMPVAVAEAAGLIAPESEVPGKTTETWLREAGIEIDRAHFVLNARLPTATEVEQLALPGPHIPIIVRQSTMFTTDPVAVETSRVLVVADQVTYVMDVDMRGPK